MRLLIYHNRHWKEETKDIKKNDVIVLVNRLSKSVFRDYCEINNVSQEVINTLKYFTLNELLEGELDNMKFNYIIGNPPYHIVTGDTTKPIWDKIIIKSYELLKEKGTMTIVHPGGWRFANNKSKGAVQEVRKIYNENKITYMELNDKIKGKETFGALTDYDVITLVKEPSTNKTTIKTKSEEVNINLNEYNVIPTDKIELFSRLKAKKGEEKVELINDYSYGSDDRFSHVSKTKNNEFCYPVVYTITEKDGITFYYSNTNKKGHFNISKLILKKGATSTILDLDGEYGMTQFATGLLDTPENLVKIQKVIESNEFKILKKHFCGIGLDAKNSPIDGLGTMFKFIKEFKKDFWKEFI